jgi:hypothetical protein
MLLHRLRTATGSCETEGYKTGYQVSHEFAVTQGARSVSCLRELVDFFGVGSVLPNRRHDNHKEHLYRYAVRRRTDLTDTIIPFFEEHPMQSAKQRDFERFARCVRLVEAGSHKTSPGLADIAEIVETMNRRKPRRKLIRILRDHTPEIQDTGS